jgi:hypothetical protein
MRRVALLVGLLFAALGIVSAQTGGQIAGEVSDPSGAAVPNAAVTVTNTATNVTRSTETNSAGLYSFPDLTPGMYNVRVVMAGFDTITKSNIQLQVQQAARVDFALTVGQAMQTVEVSASATLLATDNATVGTIINEQRIRDLPLNGRNFWSLVGGSTNVTTNFTPAAQAAGRLSGSRGNVTIAVAGARSTWENYTLDGITNTDIDFNSYILQPSVDAIMEFKVQSGIYPAEFGRAAGQVNVSTKPGTNSYHGTLSEFLRNDKLDARSYDFSSASRSATNPSPASAPYRQNQYGFTLGGPVWIPKVFNGRNRLFFMSNYEGFNSRLTQPSYATVLTPAMRNGDFSSIIGAGYNLADPISRSGTFPNITQSMFPNNQIPDNRIDPIATTIQKYLPLPDNPDVVFQNTYSRINGSRTPGENQGVYSIKGDYNVSTKLRLNALFSRQYFNSYQLVGPIPGPLAEAFQEFGDSKYYRLNVDYIIKPNILNHFTFGHNQRDLGEGPNLTLDDAYRKATLIPGVTTDKAPNYSKYQTEFGNFGGETDNWQWPRHTGDFSFLRAYVAPDGSPATCSRRPASDSRSWRPTRPRACAPSTPRRGKTSTGSIRAERISGAARAGCPWPSSSTTARSHARSRSRAFWTAPSTSSPGSTRRFPTSAPGPNSCIAPPTARPTATTSASARWRSPPPSSRSRPGRPRP